MVVDKKLDTKPGKSTSDQDIDRTECLRILKAILDDGSKQNAAVRKKHQEPPKRPRSVNATGTSTTQKRNAGKNAASRTKNEARFALHEDATIAKIPGGPSEQRRCASSAFNSNLKVLNAFVKKKQERHARDTGARNGRLSPVKAKSQHLNEIATNQITNAVRDTAGNACSELEISQAAECASAAIEVLRKLDSQEEEPKSTSQKRETGALILLDRLISLELGEKALLEASHIHKRYWRSPDQNWKPSAAKPQCASVMIFELLPTRGDVTSHQDFQLIASLQNHLLRLAVFYYKQLDLTAFVQLIREDNTNGPAAVVQQALHAELVDRKEAATHFASTSQTLSKLYAAAIRDHSRDSSAQHLFDLFFQAQLLQLQSWLYTDRKAQLGTDFWPAFNSAFTRLWKPHSTKIEQSSAKYALSKSSLRVLQQRISLAGLPSDLPDSTQKLFIDIADAHNDHDEVIGTLEALVESSSGRSQLVYKWRLLASSLKKGSVESPKLESALNDVIANMDPSILSAYIGDHQMVQTAVNLRKRICSFLAETSKEQPECISRTSDIVTTAVDTMGGLLQYLVMGLSTSEDQRQPCRAAVLKAIDDIIALERLLASFDVQTADRYLKVLDVCIKSIHAVFAAATPEDQTNTISIVAPLAVKLSNVLWRQHSRFSGETTDVTRAIELAEQSVAVLGPLSISFLQGAALGPKLENLAKLHARSGAAHASQLCRRRAAKHYITSGALEDAVERALRCTSHKIWADSGSLSCQLARCIRTFLDNITSETEQSEPLSVILDDDALPSEARFVLLELQISHIVRTSAGDDIMEAARGALILASSLCLDDVHSVWHARLYSQILFYATKVKEFEVDKWLPAEMLLHVVEVCEKQNISTLSISAPCLRSLLCLQIALSDDGSSSSYEPFMAEAMNICRHVQHTDDPTALDAIIDDVGCLISTLECVADWASAMREDGLRYECLSSIHHINRIQFGESSPKLFRVLISLLESAISVTDEKTSAKLMTDVQKLDHLGSSQELQLKSWIVQAGYHMTRMDVESCESVLTLTDVAERLVGHDKASSTTKHSFSRDLLLIEAFVQSFLLYFYKGMLREACQTARQAVRLTTLHWASLESQFCAPISLRDTASHVEKASKVKPSPRSIQQHGASYWKLLKLHADCLRQMSMISAHQGLYSDAIYYARKLHALAEALPLERLHTSAEAELAVLYARAGESFQKDGTLFSGKGFTENLETMNGKMLAISLAEAFFEAGDTERAKEMILQLSNVDSVLRPTVSEKIQSPNTEGSSKVAAKYRRGPGKVKTSSTKPTGATKTADSTPQQVDRSQKSNDLTLAQLGYEDRLQALRYKLSLPCKLETPLEDTGNNHDTAVVKYTGFIKSKLSQATSLYESAMRMVSHDTVTSLLTDSAVSLPAKTSQRRISVLQGLDDRVYDNRPHQKHHQRSDGFVNESVENARENLKQANNLLRQLREAQVHLCPSYIIHEAQKLRSKINLLTTFLDLPFSYTPLKVIFETIEPSGIAENRERHFAFAEQATETTAQVRQWHFHVRSDEKSSVNVSHNTIELIEQIPTSWQVVSIGLSEGAKELHIARVVGGSTSPFMVQLPITRSNEGDGSDEYTFAQAKNELENIIKQANKTAHEEGGHDHDTQQRQAWNKQRESLNTRLEAWLTDIDNIWLGGFRGVFFPFQFDEKLTTRFGKLITRILNKYLPSRRKTPQQDNVVDIHSHVLELFLGLGDLDGVDLDNAIMDLLYFVVDILQSSGERNAYDEIDWDNMLVDVLEAVNAFHAKADLAKQQPRHTILILDKGLICFPWENLPCLRDQPISRMPSLNALHHRLQLIRQHSPSHTAFHISKDDHKGAYVLNPGGDLTTTQSTFETILADNDPTSTYTSLISTAPTEAQFTSYLTESQILLYFGHGSGAQYIRGRHIRSLCLRGRNTNEPSPSTTSSPSDSNTNPHFGTTQEGKLSQIATTFLLGCSSAALTTHGKYEPHGPPGWYMLAGAPALVGTLWDVTDRDIDRFAVKTFAEWGLIDPEGEGVVRALEKSERARMRRAEKARIAGRGRKKMDSRVGMYEKDKEGKSDNFGEGVPLDEAVRRAREACLLRWLNGASVVVYGCPVILED